ncbi:MAG TPA: UdgX family uracil-DNA binding protein [Solirubrobacterales bacterium]|jgi:DNA polymerase|nr:UdgX family uracil-DNA binding protein [Solirubrobacterales bacterium]
MSEPGAEEFLPRGRSLRTLRRAVQDCHGCDLYRDATQAVFGEGPATARLMLVGETPGDKEDLAGEPFVGPAGALLRKALVAAGIEVDDAYLTNAVKHFKWRPRGNRRLHVTPRVGEMNACRPWLEAEVEAVGPEAIVALGATATRSLFGPKVKVTRDRGRLLESDLAEITAVTIHPSAVLRAGDEREEAFASFVADLKLVANALG